MSQKELAKRSGRSPAYVRERLKLLEQAEEAARRHAEHQAHVEAAQRYLKETRDARQVPSGDRCSVCGTAARHGRG